MPARILIVEDEQITAEDLRDILVELGYYVTNVVSSGAAAIESARTDPPDMALMDIRIKGDMDGTETARALRERFNIPVVFLTAHADRATLERAKAAEPLGYVTKPFKQLELQATIEISLHKNREDLRAREREHVLSTTLHALGMGVLAVNEDQRITMLNPTAEISTGWPANDAVGKPIAEIFALFDEKTGDRVAAPVSRVFEEGRLEELRNGVLLQARNGSRRPVEGSLAPIRDHHGEVSGVVIVFEDRNASKLVQRAQPAAEDDGLGFGTFKMVAASPAMKQVVKFARRVAESEATTILLEGESGTGKDVMAHFMHHFGKRHNGPFVAVNCAAIPENLLESELFGYEKGAFTDARSPKPGILEVASGGTVFLDEIGEMPVLLQAKMLRVLEEQTFRRLGGVRDIHVDLRVVAASNRHLADAVEQGKFRLDLYYRLNVIQVVMPPLRQRKDDVIPLAKYFIQHYNAKFRRNILGMSSGATTALLSYDWPGNVRELRNTIERAVLLEETEWIQSLNLRLEGALDFSFDADAKAQTLTEPVRRLVEESKGPATLEETERRMLIEALDKTGWNQTRAAMLLGISRDTLRYKVKKYNLPRPAGLSDSAAAE